jgi:hypothetical protein
MQYDGFENHISRKEVDVFNTLIEAVKFSFKEKPMWKFIIKYYVPAFLALGTIVFTLVTLLLFPLIEEADPEVLFANPSFIGLMICIGIVFLMFLIFEYVMTLIILTGSIVHTWGIEVQAVKLKDPEIFEAIVKKKTWVFFVYLLSISVVSFIPATIIRRINMLLPFAFIFAIPLAILFYAILAAIPNIMYKNTSFQYIFNMTKIYISTYFWKLVFSGFLANVGKGILASIIGSVTQIGIIGLVFAFSAMFEFFIESSVPIVSSFFMGLFFSLIGTLASTFSLFLLSIEQNYYTMLFCRFNNFSRIPSQEQSFETH